jgi:glycosyltransferase involved in cell wall biosynthesis
MQEELISVIVPVYNVENYLQRCVESIQTQTYKNLEIILVDDGSKDASGKICDDLSKWDDRIKVWHTENRGPSAARNMGIDRAEGKYLLFVDSDDMIAVDHIEFLYRQLQEEQADVSICNYVATGDDTFLPTAERKRYSWSGEDALKYLLYQKYFTTGPVCKLYRKKLFDTVRFPEGTLYEDTLAIPQVVGQAQRVVYADAIKYGYYQRPGSTMRASYQEATYQYVEITQQLVDYVTRTYPTLRGAAISRFVWSNVFVWIKMPSGLRDEKERQVVYNIRKYRLQVLFDPHVRWKNKGVLMLSYLGQRTLQAVYRRKG